MRIGIDIDNIIVNTTETVLKYINERLPVQLELEDIKEYRIENSLPEQYQWIVETAFHDGVMWKNVQLLPNVYDHIKRLFVDGHDIYFVTSTSADNFRKKVKHLERVFEFFPKDYVHRNAISIKNKQLLRLDVLVDDCMDNLIGEREYESICLAYPWNFESDGVYRVHDWYEIYLTISLINDFLEVYKNG